MYDSIGSFRDGFMLGCPQYSGWKYAGHFSWNPYAPIKISKEGLPVFSVIGVPSKRYIYIYIDIETNPPKSA